MATTTEPPAEELAAGEGLPAPPPTVAVLSAVGALRLLLVLLAIWTAFSGLAMAIFQDIDVGILRGSGELESVQRVLGVHLLALAFVYFLLAWRPQQYRLLLWLPYGVQAGVVIAIGYDIIADKRDLQDGALPLIIAAIFLVLLIYVWAMRRQAALPTKAEERAPAPEPGSGGRNEPE